MSRVKKTTLERVFWYRLGDKGGPPKTPDVSVARILFFYRLYILVEATAPNDMATRCVKCGDGNSSVSCGIHVTWTPKGQVCQDWNSIWQAMSDSLGIRKKFIPEVYLSRSIDLVGVNTPAIMESLLDYLDRYLSFRRRFPLRSTKYLEAMQGEGLISQAVLKKYPRVSAKLWRFHGKSQRTAAEVLKTYDLHENLMLSSKRLLLDLVRYALVQWEKEVGESKPTPSGEAVTRYSRLASRSL